MKKAYIFIFILLFVFMPSIAMANSAEPPALIVIISNAPDDITISATDERGTREGEKREVAWEKYYAFYNSHFKFSNDIILTISSGNTAFTITVDESLRNSYNKIVTLDFENQTLLPGKLLTRSILLVSLRVVLTLLIEGLIFFIFGFRNKKSWICFLTVNLLTQGVLNIVLNGSSPYASYAIIWLFLMEILIWILETIVFLIALKEKKKYWIALYVFIANMLSLIAGGYLIIYLPI